MQPNKTRRLALVALLGALSFLLMLITQFPIIPGATFLKLDLSFLPMILGVYLLDLKAGYSILLLRSLLKFLVANGGLAEWIGLPMNMVGMAVLLTILGYFMQKQVPVRWRNFLVGGLLGTVAFTLVMVGLNIVYGVPLFAYLVHFDIAKTIGMGTYLGGMVVPFNLLAGGILTVVSGVLIIPFQKLWQQVKP